MTIGFHALVDLTPDPFPAREGGPRYDILNRMAIKLALILRFWVNTLSIGPPFPRREGGWGVRSDYGLVKLK